MSQIGDTIKEARRKISISSAVFASSVGITATHLSRIESGLVPPSVELCVRVAKEWGLDADDLKRLTLKEQQNVDLGELILALRDDPSVELEPQEATLVAEWRKMKEDEQRKLVDLMIRAHEELEMLEAAENPD